MTYLKWEVVEEKRPGNSHSTRQAAFKATLRRARLSCPTWRAKWQARRVPRRSKCQIGPYTLPVLCRATIFFAFQIKLKVRSCGRHVITHVVRFDKEPVIFWSSFHSLCCLCGESFRLLGELHSRSDLLVAKKAFQRVTAYVSFNSEVACLSWQASKMNS